MSHQERNGVPVEYIHKAEFLDDGSNSRILNAKKDVS